jgi:hypothetical protein
VASPVLNQPEFQAFEPSITTDFCSLSEMASSLDEAPFINKEADHLSISPADGLKGARAAAMAIGLEAVAVFCLYGMWEIWHTFR